MEPRRADEGLAFLLRYENIAWYEAGRVRILDRRVYPAVSFVTCFDHREVARAIADMVTQSGGPYVAAAMGMALAAWECRDRDRAGQLAFLQGAADTLAHARPTTASAMEAVTRKALAVAAAALEAGREASRAVFESAVADLEAKYRAYRQVGRLLAARFPQGGTVMTQCFGETVVGMMLAACRETGNNIRVICPETRPYYQGSRLTASCVHDMGFDVTVITDNMPGYVMKARHVDVFTSAADVITMDGHVVNKIGTFQIALSAHYHGIPYYVTGDPSPAHPRLDSVMIEERDPALAVLSLGLPTAMDGVKGYYPAFDVTPPTLVGGVVTQKGIFSPWDLTAWAQCEKGETP